MKKDIENVAIVGLGAVGAAYAKYISQNAPEINLFGVVRDLDRFWGAPLFINDTPLCINYRTIDTLDGILFDLIIVAVNSYQMDAAMADIEKLVNKDTIIICLTSGMTGEGKLEARYGTASVICSTLTGADIVRTNKYITITKMGAIYYGANSTENADELGALKHFFDRCRIPNRLVDNIDYYRWRQLMIDAVVNQVSTVYQLRYGELSRSRQALEIMRLAQFEIVELANKCNVDLSKADIILHEKSLLDQLPDGCTPMYRNYMMGRRLETDVFGEYICDLASKKAVSAPTNVWLRDSVQQLARSRADIPIKDTLIQGFSIRQNIQTAPEKVADQIRTDIILAKLKATDKLTEVSLADRFGVSRASVRTALQSLTNEGLLRLLPNGRREVLDFGAKQVKDLFDTRLYLENKALEELLSSGQSEYPMMKQLLCEMEEEYKNTSGGIEWRTLDIGFHRSLVRSSGNVSLLNAWESESQMIYAMMCLDSSAQNSFHYRMQFFRKHMRLYELIVAGDRTAFPELKQHITEEKYSAMARVDSIRT